MIEPMMSGHCLNPCTSDPKSSHDRCTNNGAGNTARPSREYQPCPCRCHFPEEEYACACGGTLVAAPHWPNEDPADVEEDGSPGMVYGHVDRRTGRIRFECE